ncbi:GTP-binding nuclear protein RAN [Mycena sanguinolenta]|nr:GTP-binding nuclear protein RAN [Mycena sanguinolenta]
MLTPSPSSTFKLILVGDRGTGKTTFLKRYLTGEFQKRYIATPSAEVHPITFTTNHGPVSFDVWDTVGQELSTFGILLVRRKRIPAMNITPTAIALLIMFDVTSRNSYKNVPNWYGEFERLCGNIPIILCGNKVDVIGPERKVKTTFHRKKNLQYFEISAKANYNAEKPFLYLARKLMGSPTLELVAEPKLQPSEIGIDVLALYESDLYVTPAVPLPDDKDDL